MRRNQKVYRYSVTIRPPQRSGVFDLPGLFDMMRYDQCVVTDWQHEADNSFTISLRFDREPTFGRWRSFSLYLEPTPGRVL